MITMVERTHTLTHPSLLIRPEVADDLDSMCLLQDRVYGKKQSMITLGVEPS
jgi:hypothetical protein